MWLIYATLYPYTNSIYLNLEILYILQMAWAAWKIMTQTNNRAITILTKHQLSKSKLSKSGQIVLSLWKNVWLNKYNQY